MTRSHILLPILAALSLPSLAVSNWQGEGDLFALSLEQLMNVSIASKKDEQLKHAPSVMTVINQQDIQNYGFRNLRDILDRFVNMQVVGSNLYPHNRLSIRGVTQTHTDNKVLMLINNRVVRDANQGGINSDIYNLFPVDVIKKIEIIRGPGSTLFGTNAFSGVINIITNQQESTGTHISISAGEFSSLGTTLESFIEKDDFQTQLVLKQSSKDGETFRDLKGEFGTSGDYQTDKQASMLLANGHYKHLSFNALYSDSEQGNVKSLFVFPEAQLDIERHHLDLGYEFNISDKLTLESNLTYNFHEVAFDISNTRATQTDSQDILFETDLKNRLTQSSNLIIGARYESLQGTIGNTSDSPTRFDTYHYGLFAQYDTLLGKNNKLVLGAQYNDSELDDHKVSPRFSFIHYFNKNWTGKLLYGEAFRTPFGTDLFLDSPSLQGSEDLKAEVITTYDLQLLYLSGDRHFSSTLYSNHHTNLHERETIDGIATFVNKGHLDYMGLELEARDKINKQLELTLNASYQENEDEENLKDTTFNANTMIKLGASYEVIAGLRLSAFNSYFSEPTQIEDITTPPSSINEKARAYNLLSLNANFDLAKLTSYSLLNTTDVSIYADNLLDESIYFPSFNRQNVSSLPHHESRSIQLTISSKF